MITETVLGSAQILGIAPQFLVDDLNTAIAYYRDKLGFDLDFCYDSSYASVSCNGFAIHLKCAPKATSAFRELLPMGTAFAPFSKKLQSRLETSLATNSLTVVFTDCEGEQMENRGFKLRDAGGYVLFFGRPRI